MVSSKKGKWYIINVVSGYEKRVKEELEARIISRNQEDAIFEIIIPTTIKKIIKKGEVKEKEERLYPGYVLVRMEMTNDSWYVVRNTDSVKGFVGTYSKGQKPTPLKDEEVEKIFQKIKEVLYDLKVGDTIKVIDHEALEGTVTEVEKVDFNKKEVVILTQIMGEEREVTLPFKQISKK